MEGGSEGESGDGSRSGGTFWRDSVIHFSVGRIEECAEEPFAARMGVRFAARVWLAGERLKGEGVRE